MYGFGDIANPRADTVRLMEEIVIDYITALVIKVRLCIYLLSCTGNPTLTVHPTEHTNKPACVFFFVPAWCQSTQIANQHRRERPEVSDVKLIIRKDPAKLKRVRYLLEMKQEIRKATNVVDDEFVESAANGI